MNPLFHPRLVREHLATLPQPPDLDRRRAVMRGWTSALRRGELATANEVQLHGEFLTNVFGDVLGYRMRTSADEAGVYELRAEQGLTGRSVDGAIGFFRTDRQHIVAPIELKGTSQSLDTRKGRSQTPVQQAWEYASRAPESKWIIVSNYEETRLYSKARGWDAYELFKLEALDSEAGFARFHALLGRHALLGPEPGVPSALDTLRDASSIEQRIVTERLYETYRDIRQSLFEDICRRHSNRPQIDLVPFAQTILDRVIFCAFAEDRGLIPINTITRALDSKNLYDPTWSKWKALSGVFRGVDEGSALLGLPPLNGGLFRQDTEIDELDVSDALCERFREICAYDFAEDVSVEVLGHIFEQSIGELEELRARAAQQVPVDTQKKPSKRRAEGVFYTPSFVTRYLVDLTLAEAFRERETAAFAAVYGPGVRRSRDRDLEAWERYRESLRGLRVLDLACGSGAFLIAAFEALEREYDRVNRALAGLRQGQIEVFDLTTSVLNENLFGVDVNGESIEITKLSLWLKTARKNKRLTYLDSNICRGNSVVDDATVDPWAFDWRTGRTATTLSWEERPDPATAAIRARWKEGFDVVLGNPPYVRHELLTRYKDHWKERFNCYDGTADLFVYFFERGLSVLKPSGRLGFIVSNKWLRAGYAANLRAHLATNTIIERLVDFGHAPIFPDADTFPVIVSMRAPCREEVRSEDHSVAVTQFPRDQLHKVEVPTYVAANASAILQTKLSSSAWSLSTGAEEALFEKIRSQGVPLGSYSHMKPQCGIKTGCDPAFLVDEATKRELCRKDHRSSELLKKYLRGQDVSRWAPEWAGLWMIYASWRVDIEQYPAIRDHLAPHRATLEARPEVRQGRHAWYTLSRYRPDYAELFPRPKLIWKDISFYPEFAWDSEGLYANDLCFIFGDPDLWLLACLNSPLMWAFLWRTTLHGKDEALRLKNQFMEAAPIAPPSAQQRETTESLVRQLAADARETQVARASVLDVLRMQHGIESPGNALSDMRRISSDDFLQEVIKRRPKPQSGKKVPLSAAGQRELRRLYESEVDPMQARVNGMRAAERALSHLVNQAYGLTPEEEQLLWDTAPPRMPEAR